MTQRIIAPDGTPVDFPDGMSDAQITAAMQKEYGVKAGAGGGTLARPFGTTPQDDVNAARAASGGWYTGAPPTSNTGLGLWLGAKIPLDNAAAGIEHGLSAVGVPMDRVNAFFGSPSADAIRNQDLKYLADSKKYGAKPSTIASLVSSMAATLPLAAVTRNPYLLGAGNAALTTEAKTPQDAATDIALGTAMGKVGDVGVRAVGSVVAPAYKASVNALLQRGVKLTPGQILGGTAHRVEDAVSSIPVISGFVKEAQGRANETFNTAMANEALAPVGMKVPNGVAPGHDTIGYTQDALGHAYDQVLPNINVHYSPQLGSDISNIEATAASELDPDRLHTFQNFIKLHVIAPFNRAALHSPGGTITGDAIKDVTGQIDAEAKTFGRSDSPYDQKYAQRLKDLKGAFLDAMGQQNPQHKPMLDAIDKGYSMLTRLEPAAASSADRGVFTPQRLHSSVVAADQSIRRRSSAAGQALLQPLAEAGVNVLRPTIGDSGTATRWAANRAIAAAVFGGGAMLHINPLGLAAGAAALAPYTEAGGDVTRALMTWRPPGATAARRLINKTAPAAAIASSHSTTDARNQRRNP